METYLTRVTDYLLTQSWQIALLVVVIAAVSLVLRNKSAHVRYLLWLIVLAKCLVPPLLTVPVAILPQEKPAMPFEVVGTTISEPLESPPDPVKLTPAPMVSERPAKLTIREWFGAGWMVGITVFLVFNLLKALRTNYWLWRQRKALPAELLSDIESLFSAHGIRNFPGVWQIDGISQPFVWGLLRGSIYLPADLLSLKNSKRCKSLLGHELSHVIRFDAAVNFLQVIAQAIFWFHPFVWWANRKIRAEREKCCDEMVIARLNASPRDYSTAILEILAAKYESTRPVPSLAVAGPVKNIEERIKTMLRPGKKFYKRPSLVAATIVLLLALLTVPTALVLTARAETKAATEAEEKPAESLHQAAADGDIEQVKLLISKGADVNAKDKNRRTPLDHAVFGGHKDVAELLIAKGADLNAKDARGHTALHEAALSGHPDIVELLITKCADVSKLHLSACIGDLASVKSFLKQGMDVDTKDELGWTTLFWAASAAHTDVAEFLIKKGANIDAKTNGNYTPLHLASQAGAAKLVELLIAEGASVNAKATGGDWTPVYLAACGGHKDVVELLVVKGADVNAKNKWGWTPLHTAASSGHKEVAELLIGHGANVNAKRTAGWTPLHQAVAAGYKDVAELLIVCGADLNSVKDDGGTPAAVAMEYNREEILETLIAKGARVSTTHLAAWKGDLAQVTSLIAEGTDVNARDEAGWTTLHWAAYHGHKHIAELLIAKGAYANAEGKNGRKPLHAAAMRGHKDVAEFLIAKGAHVDAKDDDKGETPLHWAAYKGHKDVVELLIAEGADVDAKDKWNNTPLGLTTISGYRGVADLLIAKGADINAKDEYGRTPLHWAAWHGCKNIVELLIAKGAGVNVKDNEGKTPLSLAKEKGHQEIVELLRKHGAKE